MYHSCARLVQKRHRICDLLGVTTSHKGKVLTHQRCPSMEIFGIASEESTEAPFGFQCIDGEWSEVGLKGADADDKM